MDIHSASRMDLQEKFDDPGEEFLYKCRAHVTAHFSIGQSFERHQNSVHRESNRSEDYSTGFIIDYAYTQK